jgi:hypothetical protein
MLSEVLEEYLEGGEPDPDSGRFYLVLHPRGWSTIRCSKEESTKGCREAVLLRLGYPQRLLHR